ncbi:serine/threonine-protein phosphatase 6 regulatory ankyrin repeat subunit B-like [Planoprotostelium fungivorum]|uniref:Serine/threonine-protein phosphatase 6 regulatory ankyrin repeat subunit B-like n=1 Tax=Planoprotostelium fungivorum TaxID=1890364 RepID=A0A2P6MPK0_9EUKA|nr:serine/threonine-protein phosphatase 6 regulatory ankyrin repeat subunit B-like [Planoprotostelium fungivorum]
MSHLSEKSFMCCRDVKYPTDPQRFRGTSTTFTNSQNLFEFSIQNLNYRQTSFPYTPRGKKFYAERAKGHVIDEFSNRNSMVSCHLKLSFVNSPSRCQGVGLFCGKFGVGKEPLLLSHLHVARHTKLNKNSMDACTWSDLPPDNKRAIFTFLPFNSYWNALSVNREWNELMYESIDSSLPHINLDVLSWMIRQGYERIISHLLSNPTCHPRAQVIQEALDRRLFGAVNLLLDDGRATRDLSVEALSVACLYGEVPLVKRFLLLLNLTDRHNEPLLNAVSKGHREIVNILLNDGRVDPSGDDNRALISACRNGFTSIVQILLADRRVDPTAQNNRAIELACSKGHTEVVKRLIDVPGVVVEEAIAEVVASKGHHEILQMILERNPQMTSTKLLLKASVKGRLDVVRLLLKRGFKKADDILALSVCHNEQNSEIVRLLIESGDNSAEDIQKAFYQSVSRDHTETTKRLLAAGAEPSADNNYALRLICTNPQRRKTAARILLTESNFKITSEDRELLLSLLSPHNDNELVQLIKDAQIQ